MNTRNKVKKKKKKRKEKEERNLLAICKIFREN